MPDRRILGDRRDVLYVDLNAHYARLEPPGVELANSVSRRMRAAVDIAAQVDAALAAGAKVPVGPDFEYAESSMLFGRRPGRGPLYVAWDTNLLIDYFDHGARLWRLDGPPEILEEGDYLALEGLELILGLWVLRDIRFVILSQVIRDAKKRLSDKRRQDRINAFEEFVRALRLVSSIAVDGDLLAPSRRGVLELPKRIQEETLEAVPSGLDRSLVRAAVRSGVHVMMTKDRGMLRGAAATRRLGLAILDPKELLGELCEAGAFHCMLDPRCLYWPMPDQQRVAHLIAAIPDHGF